MIEPGYLITSANSIYHDEFRRYLLDHRVVERLLTVDFPALNDPEEFLQEYPRWIASSRINSFYGLNSFPERYISLGVTQALDQWQAFCQSNGFRLRTLPGEYPYTRDTHTPWSSENIVHDLDLVEGDALIVSAPFSATGCLHPQWHEVLECCYRNSVPVFVDCAFFGTCGHVDLQLDHPAILSVAFSTTKGLGCGNWRAGICFSRVRLRHMALQTEWKHGIHLNVKVSLALMKAFRPDYIFETYRPAQERVCELLGLTPSLTVHLALGESNLWSRFSRDGVINRVGIAKAIRDFRKFGELRGHVAPTGAANPV